ncbi:hypothetical protein D9M68_755680 [compost metagenome]
MIRYLLCLLAIICGNVVYAQNLSFEELVSLQQKNLVEVEEFLSAKGWKLLHTDRNKGDTYTIITFTYKKEELIDDAESFLYYAYPKKSANNTISIQVNKLDVYNKYLTALKAGGAKLLSSNAKHNIIQKIYQDATRTFIVGTHAIKDGTGTYTTYNFLVIKNEDFRPDLDLLDAAVED